ncbi:16S rRNA (cytidine(1402)-2'-O)-methyltransferase [Candidatus Aminicenantes bacterium AC-708-M15]|jgi:16S rRNA (cytidine1402-2'-O)-methyltransferase|nr:16S rRNA (cytidine(1402)-2'-O)-methyltransferase [SCandidatus Aminicenantes bacterium Aminicenantia_JdfR_composite]MCP2596810.1 16S rRNA (cytidine(1402)-2'-O)-methyltransferase [Candidatus Aminicenantes bacterium AC-335-G13]MCP2598271.1 16S rRNA (cytidine(1402)-2'-O)-methyltransferase [Candidatus Aminicenantes bacterium AC-335-L06]MCP2604010.1 16S rRNA (cytidine(1402)-2'-O)-methyltransferase [Candidatus Aminicenantes bacterium AC-708-M15]MCP2618497.1 16S rRNA (cytidine(1402)-2'-O)-methyltran
MRAGKLFIVATPIGNLEDITIRALKILREVSFIACEDTRHTIKLLNKYKIKKRLISYYQPKEEKKIPYILSLLEKGENGALVSDAGTPGISDPGYKLIVRALEKNIEVVPIPGPTALITGLCASGLPTDRFLFIGFPPRKKSALDKLLDSLKEEKGTLIFYQSAKRLSSFLERLYQILGNREIVIARELTKIHEEFLRGRIEDITLNLKDKILKGEIVVLVKGKKEK